MAQQAKSSSLGRNPSADFVKRRKSWQGYTSSPQGQPTPDVRSFVGKQAVRQASIRERERAECGRLPWSRILKVLLVTFTVVAIAAILLAVIALAGHSTLIYSHWSSVRDGTTYYVESMSTKDVVILIATFLGAAIAVIAVYGLFTVFLAQREVWQERRRRSAGLDDIAVRDLEQGDAPLETKQSIAKMMSDAEKQYVAEYIRKSAPPGTVGKQSLAMPVNSNKVTVQKLDGNANDTSGMLAAQALLPLRSWSLKRMLSKGRAEVDNNRREALAMSERDQATERGVDSSEMAAQLSSPDAFNRASSSIVKPSDALRHSETQRLGSDPATPPTPTMGDLLRQRRETYTTDLEELPAAGSTRIMVTKPVECHGDGSAASDSDGEDFDRERQHSVLAHPAKEPPFGATIMARFPQQGLEEVGPAGSLGWQDVGLGSDDEDNTHLGLSPIGSAEPGHIHAHSSELYAQKTSGVPSGDRLELRLMDATLGPDPTATYQMDVELEEVLPRPQAGLLNRLLRLARVDRYNISGSSPAFAIHSGKEYMIGLRIRPMNGHEQHLTARWIRIQPPDGQAVRFNVEGDHGKNEDWSGSACWDTSLHSSSVLSSANQRKAEQSIQIDMTIGLEKAQASNAEASGTFHVILQDTVHDRSRRSSLKDGAALTKATPTASYYLI